MSESDANDPGSRDDADRKKRPSARGRRRSAPAKATPEVEPATKRAAPKAEKASRPSARRPSARASKADASDGEKRSPARKRKTSAAAPKRAGGAAVREAASPASVAEPKRGSAGSGRAQPKRVSAARDADAGEAKPKRASARRGSSPGDAEPKPKRASARGKALSGAADPKPTRPADEAAGAAPKPTRPADEAAGAAPKPVSARNPAEAAPKPASGRKATVSEPEDDGVTSPKGHEGVAGNDPPKPSVDTAEPIYQVHAELDRLLDETEALAGDPAARLRAAKALSEIAARLSGPAAEVDESARVLESARELFSTDYYFRRWGRIALRNRSEQVDDFGLDPTYEARFTPLLDWLYRSWFRVRVEGVRAVPAEGRCMIVANHGGALPWDGLMLRTALRLEHPAARSARWLAEDFVYHMPFLGPFVARVGGVRACQENARRILDQEEVLTVFPEGIQGLGKLYRQRYELRRFGRGGYVKLALRAGAPIIPTAVIGAEEAHPLLLRSSRLARLVGLPFLPVTPTFPWLGPAGLVPLPSRWVILFGSPIDLSDLGPDAANDAVQVNRINEEVRAEVEALVARALERRESAF